MILDHNNITLIVIAVLNLITALIAWRTHSLTKQVETATNSMKDALVRATGEAAFSAGRNEARLEGEKAAAALAKKSDKYEQEYRLDARGKKI